MQTIDTAVTSSNVLYEDVWAGVFMYCNDLMTLQQLSHVNRSFRAMAKRLLHRYIDQTYLKTVDSVMGVEVSSISIFDVMYVGSLWDTHAVMIHQTDGAYFDFYLFQYLGGSIEVSTQAITTLDEDNYILSRLQTKTAEEQSVALKISSKQKVIKCAEDLLMSLADLKLYKVIDKLHLKFTRGWWFELPKVKYERDRYISMRAKQCMEEDTWRISTTHDWFSFIHTFKQIDPATNKTPLNDTTRRAISLEPRWNGSYVSRMERVIFKKIATLE
ncbi:hypothetical protein MIR68_009942 [Amoeboaphelidium protococcarum]|nr:hypothetical protein MIR68_009942 [Amoeboaphelidium protococcarum]